MRLVGLLCTYNVNIDELFALKKNMFSPIMPFLAPNIEFGLDDKKLFTYTLWNVTMNVNGIKNKMNYRDVVLVTT